MKERKYRATVPLLPKNDNANKLLSLNDFFQIAMGKFMWKLHNDILPTCIKNLFSEKSMSTKTRNKCKFHLGNPTTVHKRRFISYLGLKSWYQIPAEIKESKTLSSFKSKMKRRIMANVS